MSTLEDLHKNFAGSSAGVKALLTARRQGDPVCAAVQGQVADLLDVPASVAVAVEAVLGDRAQDLVVPTAASAEACLEYLLQKEAGRARLLPLDRIRPRFRVGNRFQGWPGVVGEAVDLVGFDAAVAPVAEALLAGVMVVETREHARAFADGAARELRVVTLGGEVLDPDGSVSGGAGGSSRTGLITRRAEMERLARERDELARRIETADLHRRQAAGRQRAVQEQLAVREAEVARLRSTEQDLRESLALSRSEQERLRTEQASLAAESERVAGALAKATARRDELRGREAELDQEGEGLESRLAGSAEAARAARSAMEAAAEALAAAREKRAQLESRIQQLEQRAADLATDKREREVALAEREELLAKAEIERTSLAERQEALRVQEAEGVKERDALQRGGADLRQRMTALRERLDEARQEERAIQKRLNEVAEAQNQMKLRESEVRLKREGIEAKARDEVEVTDLAARAEEEAFLDADGEPLPPMTDEELTAGVEETAGKIERIGPVNLFAIEEQAEMEARAEFLKSEREDLLSAESDLNDVIERLNQECTRRFDETFERVRENFQEMFRKLFGGGRGDLILEEIEGLEGVDRLEAGIEILARPPGKEPKSIAVLSGGEKALCAVALLFAIFQSKPSPFCILDEVDGPLDESNIDRFMNAVQEFSEETQFILISHAKRTMSMTDTIYGVTQDEPGVSNKYSLRFTQEYGSQEGEEAPEAEAVSAG